MRGGHRGMPEKIVPQNSKVNSTGLFIAADSLYNPIN